jgi:hypothetical protein
MFLSYLTGTDMLLSAVSVLVVAQPSSEVPEGLMNYPVFCFSALLIWRIFKRLPEQWFEETRTELGS